ncbi:hypothetical protein DFJ74DRAFT_679973 [Hyaloraphidium curvatum]|nr:hypothetical protein DFJ74DRAFT_679973 [Hyaloraphidium curvatum]
MDPPGEHADASGNGNLSPPIGTTRPPGLAQQLRMALVRFAEALPRGLLAAVLAAILRTVRFAAKPLAKFGIGVGLQAPRPGDASLSADWVKDVLRRQGAIPADAVVVSAEIMGLEGNRGLSGAMSRIKLSYSGGSPPPGAPRTLILKRTRRTVADRQRNAFSGAYREALFYGSAFARHPAVAPVLPTVYHAAGSPWLCEYTLLLADSTDDPAHPVVGANMVYGNQIWGVPKDLPVSPLPDRRMTLAKQFSYAARIHAAFWNDERLVSPEFAYLRNNPWYRGAGRARWELAIEMGRRGWEATKHKTTLADPSSKLTFDPEFVAFVDASYGHTSWEALQSWINARDASGRRTTAFTLCHNDFHASNQFLVSDPSQGAGFPFRFQLFDWSEVGPWSPGADLAQTLVSDLPPDFVREHATALFEGYHAELLSLRPEAAEDYPLHIARRDFVAGGTERWVWVFSILGAFPGIPDAAVGYFYRQVWGWIRAAREMDWEGLAGDGEDEKGVVDGVRRWVALKPVVLYL